MTCVDLEGRLAGYVAGEDGDRSTLEEHLVACADCRARFALARAGWDAAAEWRVGQPSPDAIQGVLTALETEPRVPAFVRFLQVGTLAACLLLAFAIGTSRRDSPIGEPAPAARNPGSTAPVSTGLAALRPSVGMLFVRDEDGKPAGELSIRRLDVRVDIRDGIARTEIEEIFENRTDRRLEGTFQFPLPPDASISRLAMEIEGTLMEGEVVERQKARETYEGIVRSMKDPALLEWMPGGIFQCRIFPIEPRSHKRILIAYTQALSVFDGRARYVYPLAGESMRELGIGRFDVAATVHASSKLATSGSTSHDATTTRIDDRTMRTTFGHSDFRPRSDFVLAFQAEPAGEIQLSAHRPEGAEPGYFAAFITPQTDPEEDLRKERRLLFLLDASGSMAKPELEAARMVVRRMIDALGPADRFRIGSHNIFAGAMPEWQAPGADGKRAAERYLAEVVPAGASDVAASLETLLADMPDHGELVYLGEGTPTWGEKDSATIVAKVRAAIGSKRISIRTVAVGSDSDKNLLETLSREFNGGAHAISPSDDVGARADEIARTLGRSAITGLQAEFTGGVTHAAPGTLGAIHFGERLLVTGRYTAGPAKLILTGRVHDREIRREFALALPEREAGNLHVKRLWAQRRLADLAGQGEAKRAETVALSVAHQVMTPYTSFLVLENEKAYEQHRIDRTKKDADQTKESSAKAPKTEEQKKLDRELEAMLGQAKAHFDQGRYEQCVDACDRILLRDPRLFKVDELKMIAQRMGHVKADRDLTEKYLAQWKEAFRSIDFNAVPDEKARKAWMDSISKRPPKGIFSSEDDDKNDAEVFYKRALQFYDAGDFENAEVACQRALALNPDHGASQALMLEVQFAIGKGKVAPQSAEMEAVIQMATARQQQVIFELREAMDNGVRAFNGGNLDEAGRHFRTIIEYSKWLPAGTQVEAYQKQAADMLARVGDTWGDISPAFSTLPGKEFTSFIESQGRGSAMAGITYTPGASPERLPPLIKGTPSDLRVDGYYSERHDSLYHWLDRRPLPPQVFGINRSVTIPGDELSPSLSLLVEEQNREWSGVPQQRGPDDSRRELSRVEAEAYLKAHKREEIDKNTTNLGSLTRNLELQLQEINEANKALEENLRLKAQALNEPLQDQSRESERLSKDLSLLESNYQDLARERQRLQEAVANLNSQGIRCDVVAPRKALSGQVTAVSKELDLVVISIGRDAGVNEGDEFTVYAGKTFVSRITIDRVDRAWASGRVALKGKRDPQIGDQASNNVLATPGKGGMDSSWPEPPPSPELAVLSVAGEVVLLTGAIHHKLKPGNRLMMWRRGSYLSAVQVTEVNGNVATARTLRPLHAAPVEKGDRALVFESVAGLWPILPLAIRQDLVSRSAQSALRVKLLLLRSMKGGGR